MLLYAQPASRIVRRTVARSYHTRHIATVWTGAGGNWKTYAPGDHSRWPPTAPTFQPASHHSQQMYGQ